MGRLTMSCDAIKPMLSAFHDGELPPDRDAVVRDHVTRCESCGEDLVRISDMSRMARLLRDVETPDLWPAITAMLDRPPGELVPASRGPRRFLEPEYRRRLVWGTLVTAAAIMLAVGLTQRPNQPAGDHHRMDADLARFVDVFQRDPDEAQRTLQSQYTSRLVEPNSPFSLVNYQSVAPDELPGGFRRESIRVFDMPCCKCVQTLYAAPGRAPLALFEHVKEESDWFATMPSITATCCGQAVKLVQCGDALCAAWKGAGRFMTIVGAGSVEELSQVIAVIEGHDEHPG